jgi:enterochelin esterase-like enzyme
MVVVVSIPETREPLPVLVAFHGLGEAQKGPERGARGWVDDYGLKRALGRLASPPLTHEDTENLTDRARLAQINESLKRRPYRGMVVVTPYTPDIISPDRSLDAAAPLARWLIDELLPRVRRDTPANPDASATGIDGVSLGGRVALLVGLERATSFGALGTLQPALYANDLDEISKRALAAREANPTLRLRLLTSRNDFYIDTIQHLSKRWKYRGVDHQLDVVSGPHSYAFNRGPGVYEMLLFHDRALRNESMFE